MQQLLRKAARIAGRRPRTITLVSSGQGMAVVVREAAKGGRYLPWRISAWLLGSTA